MLTKTFQRLPLERQRAFLDACLEEFADHGYDAASTNRIVRQLGISKGLLFKYARSKEKLFLYLYEQVMEELGAIQGSPELYRSPDLFGRLDELFEALLSYARDNPLRYRFSLVATLGIDSGVFPKVELIRNRISAGSIGPLFEGVDWELYRLPRHEVVEIFTWQLRGARATAIVELRQDFSMDNYVALMRSQLALLRKLLRQGVYRTPEDRT